MPNLVVNRKRALAGGGLAFNVLVNGERIGQVKNGETKTFQVAPGPLEIRLTWSLPLGNKSSKTLQVDASGGQDIQITCGAHNRILMNVIELSLG